MQSGNTVTRPLCFCRGDVDVGRVVLRDHIAAGHAVAAEVAGEARLGRNGERGLADVDHLCRPVTAPPAAGSRRCT